MDYTTVADARAQDGLRLVLTAGVPGPWSESAKAVMRQRGVQYTPVVQTGGQENEELVAWTGHRNAPIALYNNEPPRVRWNEIVELAERLGRGPSLLPLDIHERMLAVGLTNEIAGESGFAWFGRQLMLKPGHDAKGDAILATPMYRDYYSVADADQAITRIRSILDMLAEQIKAQRQRGSQYLVGDSLSIADIYWAYFSQLLDTYPPEQNPVPDFLRKSWSMVGQAIGAFDPVLTEQRDQTFERHLQLPFTF
ncbi:MAG: glutathione S-transferase C-terminal domain-containing protein [Pseudomonadales bacterium]